MSKKKKMSALERRAYNRGRNKEKAKDNLKKTQKKIKRIWTGVISISTILAIYIFFRALNVKTGDFFIQHVDLLLWGAGIFIAILIIVGVLSTKSIIKRAEAELK